MPIRILPPQLANQIAAGEVVERPASVIKELVENSLDAEAKRIQIDLERGGLSLIRIRDDGAGIPKDELALALTRHATSKLRDFDDLDAIASLGFRGEALASIASVSELKLSSCVEGQASGWQALASGREMTVQVMPVAHPVGTTVEVRELFGNVPARRRFLKSEQTELAHCEEVVRRLALARPDVHFELAHNGRGLRRFRADAPAARLAAVGGAEFGRSARFFQREVPGLRLWGWLSPDDFHRSSSDLQYFFVNARAVRDRVVSHALRQAYEGRIPVGRHPAFVLYFELDPSAVDVNVHPTKHEVRFREARRVHDFLVQAVAQGLAERDEARAGQVTDVWPSLAPERAATPVAEAGTDPDINRYRREHWPVHGLKQPLMSPSGATSLREPAPVYRLAPVSVSASSSSVPVARHPGLALGELAWLALGDRLWLVRLDALRRALIARALEAGEPVRRPLLLPLRLSLDEEELARLEAGRETLESLGFRWLLNDRLLVLREQPSLVPACDWARSFPGLLRILEQHPGPEALARALVFSAPPELAVLAGQADAEILAALAEQGAARGFSPAALEALLP